MAKGKKEFSLTDEQVAEFARGVVEKSIAFYSDKFGVPSTYLRSVIVSLRKAGVEVKLPPRAGSSGRYKRIVQEQGL